MFLEQTLERIADKKEHSVGREGGVSPLSMALRSSKKADMLDEAALRGSIVTTYRKEAMIRAIGAYIYTRLVAVLSSRRCS